MIDYRKLTNYYMNSLEWDFQVQSFMENFGHYWDAYEGTEQSNTVFVLSEVYERFYEREGEDGGFPTLQITAEQFQRYFDETYSERQRFAIIFGLWLRLPTEKVERISDPRNSNMRCLKLLDYYLCNPSCEPDVPEDVLDAHSYHGKYYADIYEPEEPNSVFRVMRRTAVKEILPDGTILFAEESDK